MRSRILSETRFRRTNSGWNELPEDAPGLTLSREGAGVSLEEGQSVRLDGPGVHTRNGDSIEVQFRLPATRRGQLSLGFTGGFEHATATLDLRARQVSFSTSDWTCPQPVASGRFRLRRRDSHTLLIEKAEGRGGLVKNADIRVCLDGETILNAPDLNLLPEVGVHVGVVGAKLSLRRFVHRGVPSGIPEYLHVGGWQTLNRESISENLDSILRGLEQAADLGIQLLVTPETSLTGLFPMGRVTQEPGPVAAAERKVRRLMRGLRHAPYLVMGLPVWQPVPGHRLKKTRYNVSRVYDPNGDVVGTYPKIHSCEPQFWHGYKLAEFEVHGAPCCMHICHDGRYPEVWTLPVMFGARLIVHPCNGGRASGTIDAFEKSTSASTSTSHAFYIRVNGGGGSYIAGPAKHDNLLAVSAECRRDVPSFPNVGEPQECLFDANIRVHDAYGCWPMRSFRASEEVAASYVALYRAMGGKNVPG